MPEPNRGDDTPTRANPAGSRRGKRRYGLRGLVAALVLVIAAFS